MEDGEYKQQLNGGKPMEKFVFIFGPQAVGKMTVGQELAKLTGLKLFHNHMTIDLLEPLYGFNPEMWRLATLFRRQIFDSFSRSDQYGMIFTKVWYFDKQADWDEVDSMCELFRSREVEVFFVELEADVQERLYRNKTEQRLECKPTKRNLEQSEHHLLNTVAVHRLNSADAEIQTENYLRINNTKVDALDVARTIQNKFNL